MDSRSQHRIVLGGYSMHITHFYFYVYIALGIYDTTYAAAESSSADASQAILAEIQTICSELPPYPTNVEQLLICVAKLSDVQKNMHPTVATIQERIFTPQRQGSLLTHVSHEEMLTPLSYALHKRSYFFAYLIAYNIPSYIQGTDCQGNTPLHYLCMRLEESTVQPFNKIIRGLIHACMRIINKPNNLGVTPIMIATNPRLIAALCMHGANIHHENNAGQTALAYRHQLYPKNAICKFATLVRLGADPQHVPPEDRVAYQANRRNWEPYIKKIITEERLYAIVDAAYPRDSIMYKLWMREHYR